MWRASGAAQLWPCKIKPSMNMPFVSSSKLVLCLVVAAAACSPAAAQKAQRPNQEYAIAIVDMPVYITADTQSQKLATMEAGREMAVLPESARGWLHVIEIGRAHV